MNLNKTGGLIIGLSILCGNFFGCGSDLNDQPELGLVSGIVTFDGKPLAGASIEFIPDEGRPATAITDEQGKYELNYIRDVPGCKIGHNKVVIRTLFEGADDMEEEGDLVDRTKNSKANVERLPAKYNDQTGLEANVQPGENQFDFPLKK